MERANVLIGASGDGWYLTRLINQSGLKRLEACTARGTPRDVGRERERESEGGAGRCLSSRAL